MSDDDLIRRGDVLDCFMGLDSVRDIMGNIAAIPAVPTFAEDNSQQGCFTAADLEAAFRLALEMAGEYMAQKSLDWRFSSPWHGKDFQRELTKLTPPDDLWEQVRQKGVRYD